MEADKNAQELTQETAKAVELPGNEVQPVIDTGQVDATGLDVTDKDPQIQEPVPEKTGVTAEQQAAISRRAVPQTQFPDFVNNVIQVCQAEHEEPFQPSLVDDLQKFWQRFTSA